MARKYKTNYEKQKAYLQRKAETTSKTIKSLQTHNTLLADQVSFLNAKIEALSTQLEEARQTIARQTYQATEYLNQIQHLTLLNRVLESDAEKTRKRRDYDRIYYETNIKK